MKKSEYSKSKTLEFIDEIEFFENFSQYEKKRVIGAGGCILDFSPGATIIAEGEKDNSFYVIHSGSVVIKKRNIQFNQATKGDIFGEMAFLSNTVRSTSVIAKENVVVFNINKKSMGRLNCEVREKIKDHCINILVKLVNKLTERLRIRM
jgi:CRP-like cAMP-binding protein